jgi:hypothetical protein
MGENWTNLSTRIIFKELNKTIYLSASGQPGKGFYLVKEAEILI